MKPTRKTGKEGRAKGAAKKAAAGARPAHAGKKGAVTAVTTRQRKNDHWRQLIETSAAWIWETDAEIRHTYTNAFVTRCLGYKPEEFLKLNTLDLVHPDDRETVKKLVQNAVARKEGWSDQVLRWRHKDGSWKYIESSGTALFDAQGAFAGLCGVDRDVTDRKTVEEGLRESESTYRGIIDSFSEAVYIQDEKGTFIDVNRGAEKMYGYTRDEFIGMSPATVSAEGRNDLGRVANLFQLAFGGEHQSFEFWGVAKNGRVFPKEVHLYPNRYFGRKVVVAIAQDITERKRAEDLLRQSEDRYRLLYEGTPVMMHSIDADGRLISVSDHWLKTLGYTREEVLGRRSTEFLDEQSRTLARTKILPDFMRTGICTDIPYTFIKKNGESISTLLSAIAERDETGKVVRSLAVIIDITVRKRAEARMRDGEKKYRDLFESSSDAIFILDLDGKFLDVNRTAYERLGYTKEEMLALHISKLDQPEFAAQVPERLALIRGRGWAIFESAHLRKDGSVMPVEVNSRLLDYEGKQVYFSMIRDITERKRDEEQLRESEEKYKFLIETTKTGYVILGGDGRVIDANAEYVRMSGHDRLADILGRKVVEWTAVHDQERNAAEVKKCLKAGFVRNLEIDYVQKNGTFIPVEINATVMRSGEAMRIFTVCRDITDRKKVENEIAERGVLLQQILDTSSVAIFLVDKAGRITRANKRMAEMFGHPMTALVGREYVELVHPAERETGRAKMLALLASEIQLVDLERHYWRKDGTEFWGHLAGRRFYDIHGTELGLIGVISDVSERKKAEEGLREKERTYRALFESASDGIFIQDETGFTDCNQRGAEMYRLPKERLIGRSPAEFAPERQPDGRLSAEVAGERVRAAMNGAPQVFEWQPLRADGSLFDVEVTLSRLELGGKLCLQAIVRDITARKQLEEERLKTQKLESIGTLAGGIAHDFNNLLQGIFGYISMAKLTIDQRERSLAMLEQAEKALHQSVNLTSQLLTFSKGGKPIKKVIDLRPVIDNAVKFGLSGSRVNYDLSFAADLSAVNADEGQIVQVVQNIVMNAEQAMPEGGTILIAVKNVTAPGQAVPAGLPDGDYVAVAVQDSGVGIPEQYLTKIFDPYFSTKEKGSGLGLATSYSIVKNHEGMIDVASVLGKGSIFTVYLPATYAALDTVGASVSPGCVTGRSCRVLVMDDEPIVRVVAGELLRELGHEAEFAEHGTAAIEKFIQAKAVGRPFDVVILDLTIRGGMGGEEALRKLLEMDPGVKAVVSSGYSDDEVVATHKQHGFRAFLKKPYDMQELSRVLNEVMA